MTISTETRKSAIFAGNDVTTTFAFTFKVFTSAEVAVIRADAAGAETTLVLDTDYTVSLNADQDTNPGGDVVLSAALATGYSLVITSDVEALQSTNLTNNGGFYPSVINSALDRLTILVQQLKENVGRSVKASITSGTDPDVLLASIETSESNAAASAAAALVSETAAAAAYDAFDDRYLGAKAVEPTLDNDGNALVTGALYWDTAVNKLRVYSGAVWADVDITGVTAFARTLLDDADAAAVLTTLGVSAFIQTVLNDADAATARATLGVVAATDAVAGIAELATSTEFRTGTDAERVLTPAVARAEAIVAGTAVAASGTSVDFTGIPAWAKKITISLSAVSTNGTSAKLIQIGDSGGVEVTGYVGAGSTIASTVATTSYTTGFGIRAVAAADSLHGNVVLSLVDSASNLWSAHGVISDSAGTSTLTLAGTKSLSAALDRVRVTTVNGTDTFDAGSINILYV